MELAEKVRHLRAVEGVVRKLGRPMTKAEVVRAMRDEIGRTISHAYLSQIETGARPHLTEATRELLSRFFKVHPGYLVNDPPGWEPVPALPALRGNDRIKEWLLAQAEQMGHEPMLAHLLLRLSRQADPRRFLWLFDKLVDLPVEEAERVVGARRDAAPAPAAGGTGGA